MFSIDVKSITNMCFTLFFVLLTIGTVVGQIVDGNTVSPSSPMARTANMYRACAERSKAPSVFRISMIVITWMIVALLVMSCIYGCFQCCTTRSFKSHDDHRADNRRRKHTR